MVYYTSRRRQIFNEQVSWFTIAKEHATRPDPIMKRAGTNGLFPLSFFWPCGEKSRRVSGEKRPEKAPAEPKIKGITLSILLAPNVYSTFYIGYIHKKYLQERGDT